MDDLLHLLHNSSMRALLICKDGMPPQSQIKTPGFKKVYNSKIQEMKLFDGILLRVRFHERFPLYAAGT